MMYTLAITNYNRYDLLLNSFIQVLEDDRIGEVLIVDDCSDIAIQHKVALLEKLNSKIKVIIQVKNRGMAKNKRDAVAFSKYPWVILFDSDNVITSDYLDAIPEKLNHATIYCPDFAKPNFDYRIYGGMLFSSLKKPDLNSPMQSCLVNTCNYLVHRNTYIDVWKENPLIKGTDTLWFALLWMQAGLMFMVVPGMQYDHLVHDGSEYMKHAAYNMAKGKEIQKLIEAL